MCTLGACLQQTTGESRVSNYIHAKGINESIYKHRSRWFFLLMNNWVPMNECTRVFVKLLYFFLFLCLLLSRKSILVRLKQQSCRCDRGWALLLNKSSSWGLWNCDKTRKQIVLINFIFQRIYYQDKFRFHENFEICYCLKVPSKKEKNKMYKILFVTSKSFQTP